MITIAFDEEGVFEDRKDAITKPCLIAGVLFDDRNHAGERENELDRINCYLKKLCEDNDAEFPKGMHYDPVTKTPRKKSLRIAFENTVAEFLNAGTYMQEELTERKREGEYHVFAYIKSRSGKKEMIEDEVAVSTNDNALSNLYIHMVNDSIHRLIFDNPIIESINSVYFDLPTRLSSGLDEKQKEAYIKQGNFIRSFGDGDFANITSLETYRSAIEREIFYSGKKHIKIESLVVRPIKYKGKEREFLDMGFLYLSDLLCATICGTYKLDDINKIPRRVGELVGERNLVFFYDSVDSIYSGATNHLKDGRIVEALNDIYEGLHSKTDGQEYYKKKWFPLLLAKMRERVEENEFYFAVDRFAEISRDSNLEQERLLFLCKQMEMLIDNIEFKRNKANDVLYDFYSIAASAYNHMAKTKDAKRCMNCAKRYRSFITLEKRLDIANREVVAFCDELNYPMAQDLGEKSVASWEMIIQTREKMFGEKVLGKGARKAYSQLAQVYAFTKDFRAESLFRKALGDTDDPDTVISMSYMLHYFIETGKKQKFDEAAKIYYGNREKIEDWLSYLIQEGAKGKEAIISLKFALYVYVKGVYKFYLDEVIKNDDLSEKLLNIEKTVSEAVKNERETLNGHPWEIIYKYLAMIARARKNDYKASVYMEKADRILNEDGKAPEGLLKTIICFGKYEYANTAMRKNHENIQLLQEQCWKEILSFSSAALRRYKNPDKQTSENLETLMTYMYH